jgi:hypothetical protein
MSWFNRKPRLKEPVKVARYRRGPSSMRVLEEAKKSRPSEQPVEVKDPNTTK